MAMMAKMRTLAPAFIISVGLLFVLFMVISDSNVLEALGGRSNDVGSINGEKISYQEFSKILDQQRENQKTQTGKDIDEANMEQFRDQVWDAVVTQKILEQQIKKYGITVSDQEIKDIMLSDNPPEFLKRNFIDSTGRFNKQLYQQALFDPRNSEVLVQAEDVVRQEQLNNKLQSMLLASVSVSEAEIKRRFIDNYTNINAKYALIGFSNFPDSSFTVTDDEMKNYYNDNLDKYQVEAQRKLKYVLFTTTPSAADSESVQRNLQNVVENFKTDTASFKGYVEIYSSSPYSKDTVEVMELPVGAREPVVNATVGSVVGPVAGNTGYELYHVVTKLPSSRTSMRASHILINQFGDDAKNYEEAMKVYNQLKSGADFNVIAKQSSADVMSARQGGDLGWFGKGDMIPEFEKAVYSGAMNVIQKPVKSKFGYHIIKVTGKLNSKFVVEKITAPVQTSPSTRDEKRNSASDFAYLAQKNDFTKEADIMHHQVRETTSFNKDAFIIPGIGINKWLMDFAFSNNKNSVSEVFTVQNGFVVVMISDVIGESVKMFDEVKAQLKQSILTEKKSGKAKELAEKIHSQVGNDIDKISTLYPSINVDTTGNFTPSGTVKNVGKDYAFIEQAENGELNKLSYPIKGLRGYYLIKVLERTPFDQSTYTVQRNQLRDTILQEKRAIFFNEWLAKEKEDADIVDNRYMFYGQ